MPPHKDVKNLTHLCLFAINKLLLNCAKLIYQLYGSYRKFECRNILVDIQEYLLDYLHPGFLDDLLRTLEPSPGLDEEQKCLILAILMHPRMRCMSPKFQLPVQDDFYLLYLKKLNNLVSLDLSMVCTDEILEVVGDHCPNLECIHIISKVDSASSKRVGLNALKLNFFISDRGLEYLHNCKMLKRIIMNKMVSSLCGGRKTSLQGIRKLVLNLSKLEYINYQDMGLVLERLENVETLKLVHLQDHHATPEHISLFARLCPCLSGLTLCVPPDSTWLPPDHGIAQQCLDRLTESTIQLSTLDLMFFPFNKSMNNFLNAKGKFINSLSIFNCFNITPLSLLDIGKCCLNIKSLHVHYLKEDSSDFKYTDLKSYNYFQHLETLNLAGTLWNPLFVFTLCLSNAKKLKVLRLLNKDYQKPVDSEIRNLLLQNHFCELQDASFFEGFLMSYDTLNMFILSCSKLISLTLLEHDSMHQFIEQFNTNHNFDIKVHLTK